MPKNKDKLGFTNRLIFATAGGVILIVAGILASHVKMYMFILNVIGGFCGILMGVKE